MGADMLVACVVFPSSANIVDEEAKLVKFAEEMPEDMIESVYNDIFYDMIEDFDKGRIEIAETVKRGFKALRSRRSSWITVGDNTVFLSGGLSWGDAPTDEYEEINSLAYIKGLFRVGDKV